MDYDQIKFLLSLPPEEIVSWYKSKGLKTSWGWRDLWQDAHNQFFAVAKVMNLDILQEIKNEVEKIFSSGITYEQFYKNLEPTLKKLGWWGRVKASDVPGYDPSSGIDPDKIVQLGSPSRLKTIFRVNSSVAYNSIRYKNQWANRMSRPYWWYIQLDRPTKRKSHEYYHNKVFLATDPIWDKIYPPNDFFCMCTVRALTEKEFKEKKLKLYDGSSMRIITGEGWDYNPGKSQFIIDPKKYDKEFVAQYLKSSLSKIRRGTEGEVKCRIQIFNK